jgi:hypothetical protein
MDLGPTLLGGPVAVQGGNKLGIKLVREATEKGVDAKVAL